MELTGFNRTCRSVEGGLSAVWLVPAADVESCLYDEARGVYTSVALRAGARFVEFQFLEGSASYRQRADGVYPCTGVLHELSFGLERADASSAAALDSLLKDKSGVVAIVADTCGAALLAGWSPEFGRERPLRAAALVWDTREQYGEDQCCAIVLRSSDVSFSKPFCGTVPRGSVPGNS